MKRFVWLSDTHLNLSLLPRLKRYFVSRVKRLRPDGLLLTGDVSSGPWLESDLRFLARELECPVYFVLGNHDYHKRHIESVHSDVRRLCHNYCNLTWLSESPVISLAPDVALVGTEGWYDATVGDPKLLRWTTDWFLTFDFLLGCDSFEERFELWRDMATRGAKVLSEKLETALESHKTVYVLTHFPPWVEASRALGTRFERLWLSYNTNATLGAEIERVMSGRKKKRVVVLAGHTHVPCSVRVSPTIECRVARASYFGEVSPEGVIVI